MPPGEVLRLADAWVRVLVWVRVLRSLNVERLNIARCGRAGEINVVTLKEASTCNVSPAIHSLIHATAIKQIATKQRMTH